MSHSSKCKLCGDNYFAGRKILDWLCWGCIEALVKKGKWTKKHQEKHKIITIATKK